jgi:uncharacterized protein
MPVRSLNSPLLRWPDRHTIDAALRAWVDDTVRRHPQVLQIGVFGSFARGEWPFGSDLDLMLITRDEGVERDQQPCDWGTATLPVPADLLVYTESEWRRQGERTSRFTETLAREMRWLWTNAAGDTSHRCPGR